MKNFLLCFLTVVLSAAVSFFVSVVTCDYEKTSDGAVSSSTSGSVIQSDFSQSLTGIVLNGKTEPQYTGVVISAKGYILTAAPLSENVSVVFKDGKVLVGVPVWEDTLLGIAIIKTAGSNFLPLSFGNSESIRVGDSIAALGYTEMGGFDLSATDTKICSANGMGSYADSLFSISPSLPFLPGSIAVNSSGEILGINLSSCFFPTNLCASAMRFVEKDFEYKSPFLGISCIKKEAALLSGKNFPAKSGIYVSSVKENSPAFFAGLDSGDIVTDIDGIKVESFTAFLEKLYCHKAGDTVRLKVFRDGRAFPVSVFLT